MALLLDTVPFRSLLRSTIGPSLVVVLFATAGCTGSISGTAGTDPSDPAPTQPGAGPAPQTGAGPATTTNPPPPTGAAAEPIAPDMLEKLCTIDTAHPRRAIRLTNGELLATLRALGPVDGALIPDGFAPPAVGDRPDEGLTVSRAYLESVDTLVTDVATKIAASPANNGLANLTCPVGEFGTNATCTTAFLTKATTKLFRGMGSAQDVTNLQNMLKNIASFSDGPTMLQYAVRAMALNPKALYLLEGLDLPANANPATPSFLSPGEMASFFSYRILGRPPSEAFIAATRTTMAGTPSRQTIEQLLASNFSAADLQKAATDFFASLLGVGEISGLSRDKAKHPTIDAAYMQKLQLETYEALRGALSAANVDFASVLTSPQRSVLAGDDSASAALTRFGRPGVFTLPGAIVAISAIDHTNVPRRGRALLKQLFCDTVPSPPANLLTMLPDTPPTASQRQRFERIEMEPNCGACHVRVNRLAYPLEAYDELGVPRVKDEHGNEILTAGTHAVPGHPDFTFTDARDLFTKASAHPVVQNCLAIQSFRHFARRGERGTGGAEDACLVRDVAAAARPGGFRLVGMFTDAMVRIALAKRGS